MNAIDKIDSQLAHIENEFAHIEKQLAHIEKQAEELRAERKSLLASDEGRKWTVAKWERQKVAWAQKQAEDKVRRDAAWKKLRPLLVPPPQSDEEQERWLVEILDLAISLPCGVQALLCGCARPDLSWTAEIAQRVELRHGVAGTEASETLLDHLREKHFGTPNEKQS